MIFLSDFMIALKCLEDGRGRQVNEINNETGITGSHIYTFKKIFENLGWVIIVKDDKKHLLEITDKGLDIVKSINELIIKIGFEGKTLQGMRRVIKKTIDESISLNSGNVLQNNIPKLNNSE